MSEEPKPAAVHDANVFLPGSLGPVRREVVLAYEHDRVVEQIRAELAALNEQMRDVTAERYEEQAELAAIKAGQGEAVEVVAWADEIVSAFIDHDCKQYGEKMGGAAGSAVSEYKTALMTVAQHERIVASITAPPATGVIVERELLDDEGLEAVLDSVCRQSGNELPVGTPVYSISLDEIKEAFRALLAQSQEVKP